jgi:restriction system protein
MKRTRSGGQRHVLGTLFDKGITATVLGLGLVLAPSLLGASPTLRAVGASVQPAGWLSLGLGVALLALHIGLTGRTPAKTAPSPVPAVRHEPNGLDKFLSDTPVIDEDYASTPASVWSPSVFEDIEWRRFEALCEALFAQAGFQTRAQSHGADGGIAIWLHSRYAEGPVAVVQCTHWRDKSVGLEELRVFFDLMNTHHLKRGTFATSGLFTAEALHFAHQNGINALDGEALLTMISHRSPEQQRELLKVAHEGEFWRPTCASCGVKMVERMPVRGGEPFWGCASFPRCRSTLPMAPM